MPILGRNMACELPGFLVLLVVLYGVHFGGTEITEYGVGLCFWTICYLNVCSSQQIILFIEIYRDSELPH